MVFMVVVTGGGYGVVSGGSPKVFIVDGGRRWLFMMVMQPKQPIRSHAVMSERELGIPLPALRFFTPVVKNGASTLGMVLKLSLVFPLMILKISGHVSANSLLPWRHLKKWGLDIFYNAGQWKNRGVTA